MNAASAYKGPEEHKLVKACKNYLERSTLLGTPSSDIEEAEAMIKTIGKLFEENKKELNVCHSRTGMTLIGFAICMRSFDLLKQLIRLGCDKSLAYAKGSTLSPLELFEREKKARLLSGHSESGHSESDVDREIEMLLKAH